jgi:predicted NBD/HSP70 family sugar kinase
VTPSDRRLTSRPTDEETTRQYIHSVLAIGHGATAEAIARLRENQPESVRKAVRKYDHALLVETHRGEPDSIHLHPRLGCTIGIGIGHEQVHVAVLSPDGKVIAEHRDDTFVADQLARPKEAARRAASAVRLALLSAGKALPIALRADRFGIPVCGITVALSLPFDRNYVPQGALGTHWRYPKTTQQTSEKSQVRDLIAAAIVRECSVDESGSAADLVEHIREINFQNAEGLAVAYRMSPERRNSQWPESWRTDFDPGVMPQWREVLLIHAGCGVGASHVTVAPSLSESDPYERLSFIRTRLHVGRQGEAGEVGHVSLDPSWILDPLVASGDCSCATAEDTGPHLESVIGVNALSQALGLEPSDDTGSYVPAFLRERDRLDGPAREVRKVIESAGKLLGRVTAPVVAMLDPDVIYLSGVVANENFKRTFETEIDDRSLRHGALPLIKAVEPGQALSLCAEGAALAAMRSQLWRRIGPPASVEHPRPIDWTPDGVDAYLRERVVRLRPNAAASEVTDDGDRSGQDRRGDVAYPVG